MAPLIWRIMTLTWVSMLSRSLSESEVKEEMVSRRSCRALDEVDVAGLLWCDLGIESDRRGIRIPLMPALRERLR